ncbi:MAG: GNAT family N-acetyltransferase [Bacteroidota bacterium]
METIAKATTSKQLERIAQLAKRIWEEHYAPIIGAAQVAYMLDKFQSVAALRQQLGTGAEYYALMFEANAVGYFCIAKRGDSLFLGKLYVLHTHRGKGLARKALDFIVERALEWRCKRIQLTVNKNNTGSIHVYQKMGFKNSGPLVQDIGGGYIMDDFLLERELFA